MVGEFTVGEIVRLLSIVNNWPIRRGGEWKMIDRLSDLLELTPEEKEAAQWKELTADGQRVYVFDAAAIVTREIETRDSQILAEMIENPPPEIPWRRPERMIYDALVRKLGGGA